MRALGLLLSAIVALNAAPFAFAQSTVTETSGVSASPDHVPDRLPAHSKEEPGAVKPKQLTDEELLNSTFKQVAVSITNPKNDLDDLDDTQSGGWKQLYLGGRKSFQKRIYDDAEKKLLEAIKAGKRGIANERQLVWTRNQLGDVYLAQDKIDEAEKLYSWCVGAARKIFGAESDATAHAQIGLATALMIKGNYPEAQALCRDGLKTQRKLAGEDDHDYGMGLITMANILAKAGWTDQADHFFDRGLAVLEKQPGDRQLDLADALRQAALFKQGQGQRNEAQAFFERSYAIKDRCVDLAQTSQLKGQIRFQWEEGSPRSQEIPDAIVPLRYICSNNVRVACTVIDLWELFGLLISVTNVGDHKQDIGLGKVSFYRTNGTIADPHPERLELVAPDHIDRLRREVDIWRLTYNRPWLANMQKSRNIRGLVPAHGHDLFRGPNMFGIYGEWNATSRVLPERFALEPSPEHVEEQAQVMIDPGLVRSNSIKSIGLTPVSLEPFESRTGELFYMNPRCEHVMLRVIVGNTSFDFPFKMPKKRTAIN